MAVMDSGLLLDQVECSPMLHNHVDTSTCYSHSHDSKLENIYGDCVVKQSLSTDRSRKGPQKRFQKSCDGLKTSQCLGADNKMLRPDVTSGILAEKQNVIPIGRSRNGPQKRFLVGKFPVNTKTGELRNDDEDFGTVWSDKASKKEVVRDTFTREEIDKLLGDNELVPGPNAYVRTLTNITTMFSDEYARGVDSAGKPYVKRYSNYSTSADFGSLGALSKRVKLS